MSSAMKRMFVTLFAALMTVALFAVGTGDGSSRANAKEYNWQTGELDAAAGKKVWYRIDLDPVTKMEDPTLGLVFRNNNSTDCSLELTVFSDVLLGAGKSEYRRYTIKANDKMTWSKSVSMLAGWPATSKPLDMYLCIESKQDVVGAADVFETEDVDDICMDAVSFDMAGQDVAAGLQWYEMDLTTARQSGKILVLEYINAGASAVHMTRGLSPECPTTGVTERELVIPAGSTVKDTIVRPVLALLPDFSYMSIEADGAIRVETKLDVAKASDLRNPCADPDDVEIGRIYKDVRPIGVANRRTYQVKKSDLLKNRHQPRISFLNQNGTAAYTVTVDIFYECSSKPDYSRHVITVPAGEVGQIVFPMNMVQQLDTTSGDEYVYASVYATKKFDFVLDMPHIREKDDCKYAANFDWSATGNFQNALGTKWYAVNIAEAKRSMQDIELWLVNRGTERADVNVDVTFKCPYTDAQSVRRQVMPNDTTRKVISYGTYGMFSNDTVWVGLTADQPVSFGAKTQKVELKVPDEACLTATDFNWKSGHVQAANDTIWYRVPLDTLRKTELLPSISITNRSSSAMTIWAELTIDCPDSIPNEKRSLSIRPAGVYSKEISRDMVNRFDPSLEAVYIRLVANQEFSFRLELEKPEQGSSCQDAYDFNWVSGNNQDADMEAWYAIDLRDAKAGNKDLSVSIYNRSNHSGLILAELASTCPCETPQKQSLSIGANQMRSKVLPHSMLSTFGEMIWIRLSGNVAIHFEADTVAAAPFTPIEACASAEVLELGHEYEQNGDTVWFVVATDTLLHTELVPQVVVTNRGTKQTIRAEVSYECPVKATMMSRSLVLDANKSHEKLVERSMCESVASQHDSVWIRLSGTSDYTFRIDLVNPNKGDDCAHARVLNPNETVIQAAGTTAWYRVEMAQLREPNHVVEATVGNIDGQRGYVDVMVYAECDGDVLKYQSTKLKANGVLSKTLSSALASAVASDWLYLQIYTEQEDSIRFVVEPDSPITPIEACKDARELVPNTKYVIEDSTMTWFAVDLRSLRENYSDDGKIHVVNLNETDSAEVDAWVAWTCPVNYAMDHRLIKIVGDGEYLEKAARSMIEGIASDTVYMRFYSTQRLELMAEFSLAQGASCDKVIPFDWYSTNPYYGEQSMWYELHLDSNAIGNHELYLHAENLGSNPVNTTAFLYDSCGSTTAKVELRNTIAVGATSHRMLLRDSLQRWGWWPDTTVYINFMAIENMRLWIDTVPPYMTVERDTICGGDSLIWHGKTLKETNVYRDTLYNIYGGKQIFVMNLTVGKTYLNPIVDTICQGEMFEWRGRQFVDSLPGTYVKVDSFKTAVFGCDSIYTLKLTVRPTTQPQTIDSTICQGDTVVWGTLKPMKCYENGMYADSLKNQFGCDSIIWLNLTVVGTTDKTIYGVQECDSTYVPECNRWFKADTAWVETKTSKEGCVSYYRYDIKVKHSYPRMKVDTTICEGDFILWNGMKITEAGVYLMHLQTVAGCDSIVYLNVETYPTYNYTIEQTICKGDSFLFGGEYRKTLDRYSYRGKTIHGCDSIVTLYLTVADAVHDTIDHIDEYCDSVVIDGVCHRESYFEHTVWDNKDKACASTHVHRYRINKSFAKDTVASIKEGETFVWFGRGLRTSGDYDTTFISSHGCDSIYRLHLIVLSGEILPNPIDTCEGSVVVLPDPKTGEPRYYYSNTIVVDTMPSPAQGGGYLIRVTNIVFNPVYNVTEPSITIREGQIASWKAYRLGDIPARSKTAVTEIDTCYTFTSVKGCDSIHCVHLNILPRTYGTETFNICEGEVVKYRYDYGHRWYPEKVFDKEGIYTVTRDNFLGGDSIVTIFVNVHPNVNDTNSVVLTLGGSFTCRIPGTNRDTVFYAESVGTYYHMLVNEQSQYGCDSTYTVHIEVYNPAEGFESIYGEGSEHQVKKVIYQNHLYIIVDDRRYDALGRRVK